jgi:hypothetical protein
MSHQRFDDLWKYIQFTSQPKTCPNETSSEKYRWILIDEFIDHINAFIPSLTIFRDITMPWWYGQVGEWIIMGLPM